MSDIERLTFGGLSSTIWSVTDGANYSYVEVNDYLEDANNFIQINDIPDLIVWLQSVYDEAQGEKAGNHE